MVELKIAPSATRLILRCRRDTAVAAKLGLPRSIGATVISGDYSISCLGPDEWFFLAPQSGKDEKNMVEIAMENEPHALVEVSDRYRGITLTGALAEDVLANGCPLDLSLAVFPVGRTTRTLFCKAEILLWRIATSAFRLEVERSWEPYVRELIRLVIQELAASSELSCPSGRGESHE